MPRETSCRRGFRPELAEQARLAFRPTPAAAAESPEPPQSAADQIPDQPTGWSDIPESPPNAETQSPWPMVPAKAPHSDARPARRPQALPKQHRVGQSHNSAQPPPPLLWEFENRSLGRPAPAQPDATNSPAYQKATAVKDIAEYEASAASDIVPAALPLRRARNPTAHQRLQCPHRRRSGLAPREFRPSKSRSIRPSSSRSSSIRHRPNIPASAANRPAARNSRKCPRTELGEARMSESTTIRVLLRLPLAC